MARFHQLCADQMDADFAALVATKQDWPRFHKFFATYANLDFVKDAVRDKRTAIGNDRGWFPHRANETVYLGNNKCRVVKVDVTSTKPTLTLQTSEGKTLTVAVRDARVRSEQAWQAEQQRLRKLAQEKAEIERRKEAEQRELERKQREEQELRRAQEAKQRELQRKRDGKQRRREAQKTALKRCRHILRELKLKRFVYELKAKAQEMACVRSLYRIDEDDAILSAQTSAIRLLEAHSPDRDAN